MPNQNEGRSGNGGSRRGFAAMDQNKQREIASKGGRAAHEQGTAHEWTPQEARDAGRKGGVSVSQNRDHMAEIGRKGGQASHGGGRSKATYGDSNQHDQPRQEKTEGVGLSHSGVNR